MHVVEQHVLVVDEAERHELGETAGALLDVADQREVRRDVARRFDVAVHDRRRRAQPDLVRGGDDLDPAVAAQLVRADDLADLVVEDLRRGAGHRAEARVDEPREQLFQRHARLLVGEVDLLGRERVDVQLRELTLERDQDVAVVRVVLARMDPALDAHLGGAARHRVARLHEQLFHRVIVRVGLVLVAREAAERAADVADVGEVDIAADHERNVVALVERARRVGGLDQRVEIRTGRTEQRDRVGVGELAALERAVEHRGDRGARPREKSFDHAGTSLRTQPRSSTRASAASRTRGSKKSGRPSRCSG